MQGVRSTRGCISCRRRKKGCDFQKPACGRCQRLHISCRYEDRQYTFVAESRRSPGSSSPPSGPTTPLQRAGPAYPSPSPLTATDLDFQVDAAFWSVYLPREDAMLDGSIDSVRAAPWIPTVRALAQVDNNVRTAISAIAYAGLGWWRGDASLVQHGLRLYIQAIRETNRILRDPAEAMSDASLALCRTLSLYEMFRRGLGAPDTGASQATDWRSHAEGTFHLVQLRGVEKHTSGVGFQLYDGVRMTAVLQGLARRKPNTFTSLSWEFRTAKTLRDELFDSMSFVPDLMQQIDEFSAWNSETVSTEHPEQTVLQANELLQRGVLISTGLQEWEAHASTLCEAESSSDSIRMQDEMDPEFYERTPHLLDVCMSHGYGFFFLCTQYWVSASTSKRFMGASHSEASLYQAQSCVSGINSFRAH